MPVEVTTVAEDLVVLHDGATVHRHPELTPATSYRFHGVEVRTLPRPPGEVLSRFGTVNDVHFGEVECGRIDDSTVGPILRVASGEEPYPITMNRAAAAELAAAELDAVVVKGDLTSAGRPDEFEAFAACYGSFGDRLHVIRGNHDAYDGQAQYRGDHVVDLPGVRLVLLDTARKGHAGGWLDQEQLDWLDTEAADADRPVLVFGHHHPWLGAQRQADHDYFGIQPEPSDALVAVLARRDRVQGYFAGHTHRNRVRAHSSTGVLPYVEVACVKDFPGSWAEYRVYEGGILQIHHRISAPDALAWSERCRVLYADLGLDYPHYALGRLADRCFAFGAR